MNADIVQEVNSDGSPSCPSACQHMRLHPATLQINDGSVEDPLTVFAAAFMQSPSDGHGSSRLVYVTVWAEQRLMCLDRFADSVASHRNHHRLSHLSDNSQAVVDLRCRV